MPAVLKDDNFGQLGFYAQGVNTITQGIVSLFADPLIKKLGGIKNCIVLGALFHSIYTAAMILPALLD